MSVESDRAKQQFDAAKKTTLEAAHQATVDAIRAGNQKILIDQPGFVFAKVDAQPVNLNDPNAFDQVKP